MDLLMVHQQSQRGVHIYDEYDSELYDRYGPSNIFHTITYYFAHFLTYSAYQYLGLHII